MVVMVGGLWWLVVGGWLLVVGGVGLWLVLVVMVGVGCDGCDGFEWRSDDMCGGQNR